MSVALVFVVDKVVLCRICLVLCSFFFICVIDRVGNKPIAQLINC